MIYLHLGNFKIAIFNSHAIQRQVLHQLVKFCGDCTVTEMSVFHVFY